MAKTILYLCPEVPYPADTGGKVAFSNHLEILSKKFTGKVSTVFLDVDGDRYDADLKSIYAINNVWMFMRKIPRTNHWMSYFSALFYFIFYSSPRAFVVRKNRELIQRVDLLLQQNSFDLVVFDHFTSFAFLKSIPQQKTKGYIYIAHNEESKVLYDQFKNAPNYGKKIYYYVEYLKTRYIENKILKSADTVVTISSTDEKSLSEKFAWLNIKNIPEIIQLKSNAWKYKNGKKLVFVGGTNYFPNYDAVDWIVKYLMPELTIKDSDITCTIVGNCKNYVLDNPNIPPGIEFTGMITDLELESLLINSNLFICPVVLGSGIKMKMLTALSYSMPVLCTMESAWGIDYINLDNFVFDRNDLSGIAKTISDILNNQNLQEQMSAYISHSVNNEYESVLKKWDI